MINTFFSLILVVAALGVVLFIVKRYALKAKRMKPDGMGLEVVSRIALQPKTHIYIVKAGKKKLLIGANEHSINTLADLTEYKTTQTLAKMQKGIPAKEAVRKFKQQSTKPQPDENSLSFRNFLNQAFRKS